MYICVTALQKKIHLLLLPHLEITLCLPVALAAVVSQVFDTSLV